jgi:hypothetical protein
MSSRFLRGLGRFLAMLTPGYGRFYFSRIIMMVRMFLGLSFDFAHLLRRDAYVLAMPGSR